MVRTCIFAFFYLIFVSYLLEKYLVVLYFLFNIKTIFARNYLSLWLSNVITLGNFWPVNNEKTNFVPCVEFCEVCSQSNKSPCSRIRWYKEVLRSAPINYHLVVNLLKLPFSIQAPSRLPPAVTVVVLFANHA